MGRWGWEISKNEFMEGGEVKKRMNGKKHFPTVLTCHGLLLLSSSSSSSSSLSSFSSVEAAVAAATAAGSSN
jgi:hypothetical protein